MADFNIQSEITTDDTGANGVRDARFSDWETVIAPVNHVINRDTVSSVELSGNGDEHRAEIVYDEWVEIVPNTGLQFPRKISVRTYALGPSGHWAGRGWAKYAVSGNFVKYH